VAAKTETFSTRWAMMLAMLGMAVGTGNIWRFPRIVAQNGGGEFLVPWLVFLVIWSIPLIMVEFGLGRKTRSGPVAAFLGVLGPKWAWMGAWIAFVATAIMFYYSVVTGWTLRYIWAALAGQVPGQEPGTFWNHYTTSWWPVLTHALSMVLGVWVVARGVTAIERVAKVMMPTLIVLVLVLAVRAITLPGAGAGLHYLFHVDWHHLGSANLWVQALTQNAWDTGAGWGLVLCYAAYLRQREDTTLNAVMLPAANNMVSLLSGIMVLCTVFAVVPELAANLASQPHGLSAYPQLAQAVRAGQPLTGNLIQQTIFSAGNEGLTFIWMPQLFARIPFGRVFMLLFFVALAFAAFTSLVSMIELATRVLLDAGLERARAIRWVGVVGFLLGMPSALSLGVLHNQDWVWGVGLMLSGLFFAIAVIGSGVRKFREEQLNHPDSDLHLGRWWEFLIAVIVPLEAVVLLVWWLVQGAGPAGWLNPFGVDNAGTILFQWGVVLVVLLALNRWLVGRIRRSKAPGELPQPPASVP
jgi:neurotransmitter:Na+ symporter, NSS family